MIVSHVVHYRHDGKWHAYGPYAREIDLWADLFPRVLIAAPCRQEPPPGASLPFTRPNISLSPQRESGGITLHAKMKQAVLLPCLLWGLIRAMRRVDAIHVRCPGNLGLLGALLAPLFSRYRVAKYAGQWNGYREEPWSTRLQRWLLGSRWWGSPVLVYGEWPNQAPHVIPFFTSMMTAAQVARSTEIAMSKRVALPLRVLFAGRLVRAKRVHALLEAARIAVDNGIDVEVAIVGDGPERANLERQAGELGIAVRVTFAGALPFDNALAWHAWAHCLVLPSRSEGWPKVIAEAMCHGAVCIAIEHGQVASMLRGRGMLLKNGTPPEIALALQNVTRMPQTVQCMTGEASLWARQHSLERLREELAQVLHARWGFPTYSTAAGRPSHAAQGINGKMTWH